MAAAAAAGDAPAAEAPSTDGPVLSLMSKRLRALRKKHNRIVQMEESLSKGKILNSEQEEVLRSKPAVLALIDEYEKLRHPLSAALHDELSRLPSPSPSPPPPSPPPPSSEDASIEDLVGLLYFGCLFDVKPQSDFTATMLTRTHERGCCLTYDYVTDDATELLGEQDLDAISALGALMTSRSSSASVSHKNALQGCIEHARLWLSRSDQPIHTGTSITYAGLRDKMNKIMASDYVTTTPEMKVPDYVAASVRKYNTACQVQVPESNAVLVPASQIDDVPAQYRHKQEDAQEDLQEAEVTPDKYSPVDEAPKDEADMLNCLEDTISGQQELQKSETDEEEQNQQDIEQKEHQSVPRRPYQNQRGSRGGGGAGGRRGGYANSRGSGRGGGRGGSYQNGRGQYYDPGYYPRNYYNTRGRGGRSGGSTMYNNHGALAQGSRPPVNVV